MSLIPWWRLKMERDHGRDRRALEALARRAADRAGEPDRRAGDEAPCDIPAIPGQDPKTGQDPGKDDPRLSVGASAYAIRMAEADAWAQAAKELDRRRAPNSQIKYALDRAASLRASAAKFDAARSVSTKSMLEAYQLARAQFNAQSPPTAWGGGAALQQNVQMVAGHAGAALQTPAQIAAQAGANLNLGIFASARNPFTGWDAAKLGPARLKMGEIIAWRAWRLSGNRKLPTLQSAYRQDAWEPGGTMTGDVSGSYGVHAWKELQDCWAYANLAITGGSVVQMAVIGKVKLWGEVIEHARGYRAEFAKVHSLEVILSAIAGNHHPVTSDSCRLVLDNLRTIYMTQQSTQGDTTDT